MSATSGPDWTERWVVYLAPSSAPRSSPSAPGGTVTIRDTDAYGCVVVQGHGSLAGHGISSHTLIRYGQLTEDEWFVSESRSAAGRGGRRIPAAPSRWCCSSTSVPSSAELADDARPRSRGFVARADAIAGVPSGRRRDGQTLQFVTLSQPVRIQVLTFPMRAGTVSAALSDSAVSDPRTPPGQTMEEST